MTLAERRYERDEPREVPGGTGNHSLFGYQTKQEDVRDGESFGAGTCDFCDPDDRTDPAALSGRRVLFGK